MKSDMKSPFSGVSPDASLAKSCTSIGKDAILGDNSIMKSDVKTLESALPNNGVIMKSSANAQGSGFLADGLATDDYIMLNDGSILVKTRMNLRYSSYLVNGLMNNRYNLDADSDTSSDGSTMKFEMESNDRANSHGSSGINLDKGLWNSDYLGIGLASNSLSRIVDWGSEPVNSFVNFRMPALADDDDLKVDYISQVEEGNNYDSEMKRLVFDTLDKDEEDGCVNWPVLNTDMKSNINWNMNILFSNKNGFPRDISESKYDILDNSSVSVISAVELNSRRRSISDYEDQVLENCDIYFQSRGNGDSYKKDLKRRFQLAVLESDRMIDFYAFLLEKEVKVDEWLGKDIDEEDIKLLTGLVVEWLHDLGIDRKCVAGQPTEPHAAIFYALGCLGLEDLLAVEQACKSFRDIVREDVLLWKSIRMKYPLNKNLTDEILLKLVQRSQGHLEELILHGCFNITDDGLMKVLEISPNLTKLCIPWCARLTPNGIIRNVKAHKEKFNPGLKQLRTGSFFCLTREDLESLNKLLGDGLNQNSGVRRQRFYHRRYQESDSCDDGHSLDLEACPKCDRVFCVYDCTLESCQKQNDSGRECRACPVCIFRCTRCGRCINGIEYDETFYFDKECLECSEKSKYHRCVRMVNELVLSVL